MIQEAKHLTVTVSTILVVILEVKVKEKGVNPLEIPRTCSKHRYKFRHIPTNTNAYKYSSFPCTIPSWNNLPTTAITVTSLEAFQVYALPIIRTFCHPN